MLYSPLEQFKINPILRIYNNWIDLSISNSTIFLIISISTIILILKSNINNKLISNSFGIICKLLRNYRNII